MSELPKKNPKSLISKGSALSNLFAAGASSYASFALSWLYRAGACLARHGSLQKRVFLTSAACFSVGMYLQKKRALENTYARLWGLDSHRSLPTSIVRLFQAGGCESMPGVVAPWSRLVAQQVGIIGCQRTMVEKFEGSEILKAF